jgi:hypothetical protein
MITINSVDGGTQMEYGVDPLFMRSHRFPGLRWPA